MQIDTNPLTTLAVLKTWLGITSSSDDIVLQWSIDRASRIVQSYCGRNFTETRYYEIKDGSSRDRLRLDNYPVSIVRFVGVGWNSVMTVSSTVNTDAIATVSVDADHLHLFRTESTGSETSTQVTFGSHDTTSELVAHTNTVAGFSASLLLNVPARYLRKLAGRSLIYGPAYLEAPTTSFDNYQIDLDAGVIYGDQLRLYRSILVDYTAGYATIPSDVENAVISVASRLYRNRTRDPGIQSESLGGYSYSLRSTADLDAEEKSMLSAYRRIR